VFLSNMLTKKVIVFVEIKCCFRTCVEMLGDRYGAERRSNEVLKICFFFLLLLCEIRAVPLNAQL
jgi:hypothetical protein